MSTKLAPIIVIKKKGGHGGHHGGAWKVAYADFVTAMMSLFIVLWLMSSSAKVKKAVAGYFNDPKGTGAQLGTMLSGTGDGVTIKDIKTDELEKEKEKIEKEIASRKDLEKLSKQVEITVTPEGLRIELLETKNGTFYEIGSPKLSASGQALLALLASELKTLPNSLLIEGHTDATPYSNDNGYSNWDLSADRANSARRLMQQDGVRDNQVTQVRGYADMLLRVKSNPTDPSNRRVSILVKNDTEHVPEFSAAKIVNGSTPIPRDDAKSVKAGAKAGGAAKPVAGGSTKSESGAMPPDKAGSTSDAKAVPTSDAKPAPGAAKPVEGAGAPAGGKPAAGTPAAKPGLLDRLKAMLPGHKKAT